MPSEQLRFLDIYLLPKPINSFPTADSKEEECLSKVKPDPHSKEEKSQSFTFKTGTSIYPYTQRRSRWATLQQDTITHKTPLKDGKLSLFQLDSEVKAYDGKIFSLKKGELITAFSKSAQKKLRVNFLALLSPEVSPQTED